MIKPAETYEETAGSSRFRDTNALVNEVAKTDPQAAKEIALDAAKQRGAETLTAFSFPILGGTFGPVAADVMSTGFSASALHNLTSDNGIKKTIRLANQRDYSGATRSALGDLLDLSILGHTGRLVGRLGNSIYKGASLKNAYGSDVIAREFKNGIRQYRPQLNVVQQNYQILQNPTTKQTRVISEGTYPLYTGPQHSISEVVNVNGTVNPRAALKIQREVADNIPGAYRMESRLENPEWHLLDPTTWDHTKQVARSAWTVPTPKGFTKQDQMVAALGHDFGKIVAGEGHGQIGADLISQIFHDVTPEQLTAIREHMGSPKTTLGLVTKQADILNGNPAIIRTVQPNGKIRLSLPSHTDATPRQFVLDPQGKNKFYVHMRTWDGDHIPAKLSSEDKTTLFNALYEELPEGAEILFPQSGPGNYATRGTVAGLQRLARDSRFRPSSKGILEYIDKDGTVKTFEGTGFIKGSRVNPLSKPISMAEKLGIPKSERSNPKALEDLYYWGYQQWNSRYNDAVNSGNIKEAQRLRDSHFKIKTGLEPVHLYHGTNTNFTIFDENMIGSLDPGWYGRGFYFTPDKGIAEGYASAQNGPNIIMDTFLNIKNPIYRDAGIYDTSVVGSKLPTTNDGVFVRLGKPDIILDKSIQYDPNEIVEIVVPKANQIKSTNVVTYDNNGNLIPIVKRDNFHNPDIRYKQGGILKAQLGAPSVLNPEVVKIGIDKTKNSGVGKFIRDLLNGKDSDLTKEEYFNKHGYNKPIGSIGVIGLVNPEAWAGLEYPEIAKEAIGFSKQIPIIKESTVPIKEVSTAKKVRTASEKHESFLKALDTWSERHYGIKWSKMKPEYKKSVEKEYRDLISKLKK